MVGAVNKEDRHSYEAEVVEQAETSLSTIKSSFEEAHAKALETQNVVIGDEERAKRVAAKSEAEKSLEGLKATSEEKQAKKTTAHSAEKEAKNALKAAKQFAAKVESEVQDFADKKESLSSMLAKEVALLKEGTCTSPEGKVALKTVTKLSKKFNFDDALLNLLAPTCQKEASARTEFELMSFTSLESSINKEIAALAEKVSETEPRKAETSAAVEAATTALQQAESAVNAADEELKTANAVLKEASKGASKAAEHLGAIWKDMKEACDAQDELAKQLQAFKDNVLAQFQLLKEKAPEPEPVEAEPEAGAEAGEADDKETAAPDAPAAPEASEADAN
jgi:hypothetical protein